MANIDRVLLDRLTADALHAVQKAHDDCSTARCASPAAITLLLRQYALTGRDDLRDAVGAALARALHQACVSSSRDDSSAWLPLLVEASALSEDERLEATIESLADALAAAWPESGSVASIARSIGATLVAASQLNAAAGNASLVARAIDEMERLAGHAYTPGSGLVHELGGAESVRGTLADHAAMASTLLAAYTVTARLPYAMLADELMQFAMRQWWRTPGGWNAAFADACDAVRVQCRLAALYRDEAYQEAAVLAEADYAADAEHAIEALDVQGRPAGEAALYGLAVFELLAIQSGS